MALLLPWLSLSDLVQRWSYTVPQLVTLAQTGQLPIYYRHPRTCTECLADQTILRNAYGEWTTYMEDKNGPFSLPVSALFVKREDIEAFEHKHGLVVPTDKTRSAGDDVIEQLRAQLAQVSAEGDQLRDRVTALQAQLDDARTDPRSLSSVLVLLAAACNVEKIDWKAHTWKTAEILVKESSLRFGVTLSPDTADKYLKRIPDAIAFVKQRSS